MRITTARFHHDRPVIGLDGIDDVDTAATLAGAELRVPVADLAPLPEGAFYRHHLEGCQVVTTSGTVVGVVRAVEGEAGGHRLVVESEGGDVLVPLAARRRPQRLDDAGIDVVIHGRRFQDCAGAQQAALRSPTSTRLSAP